MHEAQIKSFVRQLDTKDRAVEESAWAQLRPLGAAVVPYLAEFYPNAKKLEGRRAIVFHAIKRRNHHHFVDRDHTGRMFWEVNEGDAPDA